MIRVLSRKIKLMMVLLCIVGLSIIVFANWAFQSFIVSQPLINLIAETSKATYVKGEPVEITVRLVNGGDKSINIKLSSSKIASFIIKPSDSRTPVYYYDKHAVYQTVLATLHLDAHEAKTLNFVWNQIDDNGVHISPGTYEAIPSPPALAQGQVANFSIKGVIFKIV